MMNTLHPQYIITPTGERQAVVLLIAEWEAVLDQLEQWEDLEDAHEILALNEPTIPWEAVKTEMGIE